MTRIANQPEWQSQLWKTVHEGMETPLRSWRQEVGVLFQASSIPENQKEATLIKIKKWIKTHCFHLMSKVEKEQRLSKVLREAAHEIIRIGIREAQKEASLVFDETNFVDVKESKDEEEPILIDGEAQITPQAKLLEEWNANPNQFWAQRPYPGKEGVFSLGHPNSNWNYSGNDDVLTRFLQLVSSTQDSFLQKIYVSAMKDGSLIFGVVAFGKVEPTQKIFESLGVTFDKTAMYAEATKPEQIQTLANLTLKHNKIDEPWRSLISDLAKTGVWYEPKAPTKEEARGY